MKKKARDLKVGSKIKLAGKLFNVSEIETSDIGKQGVRKCRIVAKSESGEDLVLIRPEDYPFEEV